MMSEMTTEHVCFDNECAKWERINVWRMIEMMTEHVCVDNECAKWQRIDDGMIL